MRRRRTRDLVPALLLFCGAARAGDIHVPGDAPSIPAAIALAADGDSILVAPGTWAAPVDFASKGVRIASDGGFAVTTIDGGLGAQAVLMSVAAGADAELDGFTIIGGTDARLTIPGAFTSATGGSFVHRCRIGGGAGPGIKAFGTGDVRIEDCLVHDNAGGGVQAAGIFSSGELRLQRCVIEHNGSAAVARGGGVLGSPSTHVVDCLVSQNTAVLGGGGASIGEVTGSVFLGNEALQGGGGYHEYGNSPLMPIDIAGAAFIGNHAPLGGGVFLQQVAFAGLFSLNVTRCVIAGNTDDAGNVGLLANVDSGLETGETTVSQCTLLDNRVQALHTLTVSDSIVRGGSAPLLSATESVSVSFSDVQGGWPGTGNVDAVPGFVDPAHGVADLLPGSPCIDTGDPAAPHDPDGSVADIGALAFTTFCDAGAAHFGARGLPGLTSNGTLQAGSPVQLRLTRARPGASAVLVLGLPGVFAPLKDGTLVPAPLVLVVGLPVDSQGSLALAGNWPAGLPSGLVAWTQFWIPDGAASDGFSASNGLGLVAP